MSPSLRRRNISGERRRLFISIFLLWGWRRLTTWPCIGELFAVEGRHAICFPSLRRRNSPSRRFFFWRNAEQGIALRAVPKHPVEHVGRLLLWAAGCTEVRRYQVQSDALSYDAS